jgi:outer membrane biosynthesis protein TonB
MSRLQKKCIVVSTGLHLLLLGLILVGPAFTSSTTPEVRMIDFTPTMVVAENIAGGGNPNARPPAAISPVTPPPQPPSQPPPQPKPEPKTAPKPEPDRSDLTKSDPSDPDDWTTESKKKPQIVTTPQIRRRPSTRTREDTAEAEKEARKAVDARRDLARAFANAATGIKEGSASATAIDEDFGPGGGGPAYAGYDSLVQKVYQDAWVKPSDTSTDSPVTYATVTIARDGTVVPGSARIITRSGDSQMDSSVQRVLERVFNIGHAFPEGMKEKQRTYKIRFDLTKRGLT